MTHQELLDITNGISFSAVEDAQYTTGNGWTNARWSTQSSFIEFLTNCLERNMSILINSKTALRDKFYIICMEEGIECIYCKTTWHDGSGNVETKERPFTVKRCLRLLKQLEQLHWSA